MGKIKATGKELKKEVLVNIPNTLTILRLVLAFVFAYLVFAKSPRLTLLIIFIVAAISDFFDGFLARSLKQTTRVGALLDQYIDRIFSFVIVLSLLLGVYLGYFSDRIVLIVLLVSSREILGLFGVFIRIIKRQELYQVKYIGKIVCWFQGVTIGMAILGWYSALYIAIATAIVGILAGFDYLRESLK